VEDRISGGLQHRHEMCCKKGGHHGRRACMVWRWFHHGDVISGQVDLYMTLGYKDTENELEYISVSELTHAVDLLSNFHITYPTKLSLLPLS